jgi:hypothetical protein
VAVAEGGGTVAVIWEGWSAKTSLSTRVVGRLACLAEAGDASLERVLRKVDLRFGGSGRVCGRGGTGCVWRSL